MNLQTFSKTSGAFTKAKIFHYYPLPVKKIKNQTQSIFELVVDILLYLKTLDQEFIYDFYSNLLNGIIYEVFFDNKLKAANKEILKHLGDLKPITDEMSEEEKLAIIQSEFERLYDDNHPVKYAIETLDSIEEVRIIKDALK